MKYALEIDIGGTKCAVTVGSIENGSINIVDKKGFLTASIADTDDFFASIFGIIDEFKLRHEFSAIGISCGGPLDENKGIILCPPNLPFLHYVKIVDKLTERYGVPAYLRNDANACTLAEWLFGAGRGTENMVFLTFGTGLGAGLILNGQLYSGTNGNAGEVGHIRLSDNGPSGYGKAGSFEGFCSGQGIAQLGYTLGLEAVQNGKMPSYFKDGRPSAEISAKDIAAAADRGDEAAIGVYAAVGKYLGRGLSILIDILNPERIVIGSIFRMTQHLMIDNCLKEIKREALSFSAERCEITASALGESIGDVAALAAAVYNNR